MTRCKQVQPAATWYFNYPIGIHLQAGPKLFPKLTRRVRGSRYILKLLAKFDLTRRPSLVKPYYVVNERIVEIPFVIRGIEEQERNILDVGCFGSPLPLELAHLGFNVWGLDPRGYPVSHPNLRLVQGDVCRLCFPAHFFDVAVCLSTIEHVGIGHYGDVQREHGDAVAMKELWRVIKPGGKFILTAPFGHSYTTWQRIYDSSALGELLSGFTIEKRRHLKKLGEAWIEVTESEALEVNSPLETRAVVLVIARKSAMEPPR